LKIERRKRQPDRPLHESQTASLVAPHTVSLYCIILLRSHDPRKQLSFISCV